MKNSFHHLHKGFVVGVNNKGNKVRIKRTDGRELLTPADLHKVAGELHRLANDIEEAYRNES